MGETEHSFLCDARNLIVAKVWHHFNYESIQSNDDAIKYLKLFKILKNIQGKKKLFMRKKNFTGIANLSRSLNRLLVKELADLVVNIQYESAKYNKCNLKEGFISIEAL